MRRPGGVADLSWASKNLKMWSQADSSGHGKTLKNTWVFHGFSCSPAGGRHGSGEQRWEHAMELLFPQGSATRLGGTRLGAHNGAKMDANWSHGATPPQVANHVPPKAGDTVWGNTLVLTRGEAEAALTTASCCCCGCCSRSVVLRVPREPWVFACVLRCA